MCLIIQRPAKVTLPFEKFKTAVENNPHGYGLAIPDNNGKLITLRDHNKPDPEVLYKLIHEEFKDQHVMIHLRYTTAGDTSLRNAHPFPVLEKRVDGVDLRMAHNGTLFSYKGNTTESDTRRFVKSFVRPLFKRLVKGMDVEEILTDPFVNGLLHDKMSTASVLTFVDGNGNTLEINAKGNGGDYSESGVYYSNVYSFDPEHRKPKKVNYGYGSYVPGGSVWDGENGWVNDPTKDKEKTTPNTPKSTSVVVVPKEHAKDTRVKKFSEEYQIDPKFFFEMTDTFIDQLVENDEEGSKMLIKELLFELELQGTYGGKVQ